MSETVAVIRMRGESGWVAYNLQVQAQAQAFIEEVRGLVEGSLLPDHVDEDSEPATVTIEVRQKADGYVDSLPEFQGW